MSLLSLPVGHYSVSVAAAGFKTHTVKDLQLNVSDRLAVNATLVPGQVSEVVNVQAQAFWWIRNPLRRPG